jgi:formylglycine-generating enzyme required for sulfatase activity
MTNQPSDKQAFERLRDQVTDLLLAANSPARNIPGLKPLIDEYQGLVQRQNEISVLEAKIAEALPVVEQAEAQVAAAEKQVLAEKKQLAAFAGELGRAVFAGFQAGELPDQPVLAHRKDLQAKIDALQQQRSTLLAEDKSTFLDKTKQQAQQLALAGQIKVEELKIGSADRALGEAILGSKDKITLKCNQTESVLKAIVEQKQRVAAAKDNHKATENAAVERKAECGAKLGRDPVQSTDLKSELKDLRSEVGRNSKRTSSLRDQLLEGAIKSDVAKSDSTLGPKLAELTTVQESIAANRPQLVNALGSATDQFKKLPAGKRRGAVIVVGSVIGIMLLVLLGRGIRSDAKRETTAEATALRGQSSGPKTATTESRQSDELTNSLGMKLVLIPKGTFTMGSPVEEDDAHDDEEQHEVTIDKEYWLGVYEVTQGQYEKVMGRNPSRFKNREVRKSDSSTHPVENVSWEDAVEFCKRLSESPEEARAGRVYRLPTEAEWEYACRAGSKAAYCFGENVMSLGDYAWFSVNSQERTNPVGEKKPNAWGIHDMHGNVWEWCSDWYSRYPKGPVTDPLGPRSGVERVIRGGSWNLRAAFCRSAGRPTSKPSSRYDYLGFRVAMTYTNLSVTATEQNVSTPSTPPARNDDGNLGEATFRYTFNGRSYTGTTEGEDGSELVFYDAEDTLLSFTVDRSTSTVVSSFLGVTDGRLHLGGGKENILLQLTFRVEGQPTTGSTRRLATSRDPLEDYPDDVRGLVTATYLRPGPSYKTHWFGKPASSVPKDEQEIVFRKGANAVVGLGIPFKIESNPENVRVLYADFSPKGQLAMLKDMIADPGLQFVIGDRTLRIDDSARRTIYLLERAVAVLRYRQGSRDAASRPSLGD